ncbi:hypothetical protein ACEWX3_07620 [Mycobacterium sp. G7A2]|uniref:hypothetical protein n=1 Tax=Mycobacterium sp. G7A2 TaxID=3317307 RepID=UPI0035A92924
MAELTTQDVHAYTGGRLASSADETTRLLNTALNLARRYCGWHVTPVQTETVVMDGPGSTLLVLPTLQLESLTAIVEDGVTVDLDYVGHSPRGLLLKKPGYVGGGNGYRWSSAYSGISVTMTHGFEEAPEWQSAVLSYVDRTSLAIGSVGQRENVGPFSFSEKPAAAGSAFTDEERMLLDLYRLEAA